MLIHNKYLCLSVSTLGILFFAMSLYTHYIYSFPLTLPVLSHYLLVSMFRFIDSVPLFSAWHTHLEHVFLSRCLLPRVGRTDISGLRFESVVGPGSVVSLSGTGSSWDTSWHCSASFSYWGL